MTELETNANRIRVQPPHPQMLPFFQRTDQTIAQFFHQMLPLRRYLEEVTSQLKLAFTPRGVDCPEYNHGVATTMNWLRGITAMCGLNGSYNVFREIHELKDITFTNIYLWARRKERQLNQQPGTSTPMDTRPDSIRPDPGPDLFPSDPTGPDNTNKDSSTPSSQHRNVKPSRPTRPRLKTRIIRHQRQTQARIAKNEPLRYIIEARRWIRDCGWLLLGLMIALYLPSANANDNVIFEQIGKMAGSTSYLHPHITINLSAITLQYEEYRTFLAHEIDRTRVERIKTPSPPPKVYPEIDPWEDLRHRVHQRNQTPAYAINAIARGRVWKIPYSGSEGQHITTSEEYHWRTRHMKQPGAEALLQMTNNHRTDPQQHTQNNAQTDLKQVWHRIAKMHWDDLMDIGLYLESIKQILPMSEPRITNRVGPANFFSEFAAPAGNIIIEDGYNLQSALAPEDWAATLRYQRDLEMRYSIQSENDEIPRNRGDLQYNPTSERNVSRKLGTEPFVETWVWDEEDHNPPSSHDPNHSLMMEVQEEALSSPVPTYGPTIIITNPNLVNLTSRAPIHSLNKNQRKRQKYARNQTSYADEVTRSPREKRLVGVIALGVATAAASLGAYNTMQIEFLKTELTEVKENTRRLFEIADIQSGQLEQISGAIRTISTYLVESAKNHPALYDTRLTSIENNLRDRIRQAAHALQAAQQNRLAVDYLSPGVVRRLFEALKPAAAEFGCELLIQVPSDLYHLETSLLFDGINAHLLLHVPMVHQDSILRLFRLNPYPLPLFSTHFLVPRVKSDILAISSTAERQHLQLAAADLIGCHRIGDTYLCDQFGVQSVANNNSCLGALYDQKFVDAQKLCQFDLEPIGEKIYSLQGNQFLIYLDEALTVPISCTNTRSQDRTAMERHLGQGHQRFILPPGCNAQFRDHIIFSDLSIRLPSDTIHFDWSWDTTEMFTEPSAIVSEELRKLQEFGVDRPTLESLNLRMAVNSDAWNLSVKEGLIIGCAVLLITIMLLFSSCATIAYVRRQKLRTPISNFDRSVNDKQKSCFSIPNLKTNFRRKPEKKFTISYRKANTIDSEDNVDIRPTVPPRPMSTYIPDEMAGYTLPNPSRQNHMIHPTSSLNRLRSEIEVEVNPAIKYFTMERESRSQSEEHPTAPTATPMTETDLDLDFYHTPLELQKSKQEDND